MKRLMVWVLAVAALNACQQKPGLQIGDAMPSVALTDFSGNPAELPGDLKGKVLLVRFWALDCDFCSKDILFGLETMYQKYKKLGFVPVLINECRVKAGDERLKQFAPLTYPLLTDPYGMVAKRFGVIALPTTFIFDEKGILRDKITGEAGIDEFEKRFTTVLHKEEFYDSAF
ncbi:MAG: TlpA family protein disulfide reductase, partial [Methylosarcina sp.]